MPFSLDFSQLPGQDPGFDMNETQNGLKALFDRAVEIESVEDRTAYLDQACDGDAELRNRIDALLKAYEDAGSFLQSPP